MNKNNNTEIEKKGFSIRMPLAYHQKLKIYAIQQNKTMSRVIIELIEEKIMMESIKN